MKNVAKPIPLLSFLSFISLLPGQVKGQGVCGSFKNCVTQRTVPPWTVVCRDCNSGNLSNIGNYTYLNYQWNILVPQIFPIGYFLPESTNQIQVAVKCAQALGVPVVAKSGGHGYGKYAFGTNEGIVIDLQRMTSLSIDPTLKTALVGPGFLSGPLAQTLYTHGQFMLPNGMCATVGISFSLGGGYSWLTRAYGLALDNILELEMVDSNGQVLTANHKKHNDLFFALRGAGGGSYGIITRYKFKIYPAPFMVSYGRKSYPLSDFPQVFQAYQNFAAKNPPVSLNCVMTISRAEILVEIIEIFPTRIGSTGTVTFLLNGHPFPLGISPAQVSLFQFQDYLTTVGAYGGNSANIGNVTRHDYGPLYFHGTSFYVRNTISIPGILLINQVIQNIPDFISIEFQMNGGAINNFKPTETAYVHRNQNIYKVASDYLGPVNRTRSQVDAALGWQESFLEVTEMVLDTTESYQNNVDPDLQCYLERYYGENLPRLVKIKRKYDPNNYFNNPQSIPTSLGPSYCVQRQ